jgi:hypothetical protein
MTLTAVAGRPFEATVTDAPSGLVGVLGVAITDGDGGQPLPRTTEGIVESPSGSGVYTASLTAPDEPGDYVIVWDTGGSEPEFTVDDLLVLAAPASGDRYASVEDVERYTPARAPYGATGGRGEHTRFMVEDLIVDASAEIDQALTAAGYPAPMPESATRARQFLRAACAKCVAATIEETAPTQRNDAGKMSHARRMCAAAMQSIAAGELPGATKDAASSAPRSGFNASRYFTTDMQL